MADVINLNKARKVKKKTDRKSEADENRVHFGMTRGEKAKNKAAHDTHDAKLDGLQIPRGPKDNEDPA